MRISVRGSVFMPKILLLFLIFSLIHQTSFSDEIKITVRNEKVIFEHGTWKDVQNILPLQKLFFNLSNLPVYEFKDTPKQLYIVLVGTSNFKNESSRLAVYGNGDCLGVNSLYYCPQDNGIYCGNIEQSQVVNYTVVPCVSRYYRIAEGVVENKVVKKIIFSRGTFCSYRYKVPFSWGKDPNHLSIIVTERLNGVSKDYFNCR